jgi:UDP-N-acetylmuramate--alanine ligase
LRRDRVDFFHTPEAVTEIFEEFAATISSDGFLVYCADDSGS